MSKSEAKYTEDWSEISLRVRQSANHRCEICGAERGELRTYDTNAVASAELREERRQAVVQAHFSVKRKHPINDALLRIYKTTGKLVSLRSGCSGKALYAAVQAGDDYSHIVNPVKITTNIMKVYLQVHHKDEDPSNNEEDNLVCLCGRCHMRAHGRDFNQYTSFIKPDSNHSSMLTF